MKGCDFDCSDNMGERVIHKVSEPKNMSWYAFVPREPEIFGHTIVTVEDPCIREIISHQGQIEEVLKRMVIGIKFMADLLIKIDRVQRIYIAMLGETETVHMHYHLFPRYGFVSGLGIDSWAEKNRFTKGLIEWQRFYSRPTSDFKSSNGFQYLGEIENSYNEAKRRIGTNPSDELIKQMAERIIELKNSSKSDPPRI